MFFLFQLFFLLCSIQFVRTLQKNWQNAIGRLLRDWKKIRVETADTEGQWDRCYAINLQAIFWTFFCWFFICDLSGFVFFSSLFVLLTWNKNSLFSIPKSARVGSTLWLWEEKSFSIYLWSNSRRDKTRFRQMMLMKLSEKLRKNWSSTRFTFFTNCHITNKRMLPMLSSSLNRCMLTEKSS